MLKLFRALSRTSDGAFVINNEYKIIFWNQAAQKMLGYSPAEAANLLCYQALGGIDEKGRTLCQRYCRLAMSVQQGKDIPTVDVHTRTASGVRAWINVTTIALPTRDHGEVIVHLFRDSTQKKKNEQFVEEIMQISRHRSKGDPSAILSTAPSPSRPDGLLGELTPRETEVLLLLTHGSGTREIASTLSISPSTTRNHIQSILDKLGVHSRLEAVAHAYQYGLGDASRRRKDLPNSGEQS